MSAPIRYGMPYGSTLHGLAKLTLLAGWITLTFLVQPWILLFSKRFYFRSARIVHHTVCRILGIRVLQIGTPCGDTPVLFVANHSSYLDIPVLGSLATGCFVAKSEIESWPVIGALCKLQNTIFVQRKSSETNAQRNIMRERLEQNMNLILFAEGTSTDGAHVLPFKSSLFSTVTAPLPDGRPIMIQPVSITALTLDGIPMGRTLRPLYAWYGDMTLANHGWPMLRVGRMTVAVEFHPPVRSTDFGNRKALAQHCTAMARLGVTRALAGRDPALQMLLPPAPERATPRQRIKA